MGVKLQNRYATTISSPSLEADVYLSEANGSMTFLKQKYHINCIFFVDPKCVSMKCVLLKGPIYSMTVYRCPNNMISLNNYGNLVEA